MKCLHLPQELNIDKTIHKKWRTTLDQVFFILIIKLQPGSQQYFNRLNLIMFLAYNMFKFFLQTKPY